MTSYLFFNMAAIESNFSGFHFSDDTGFGRVKSTHMPNFDEISQSMAEITLYFRFLKMDGH